MAYCEVSDVISEFKDLDVNASTSVTLTEIQDWIDEDASLINSYISKRYTVPVVEADSPMSFEVLKMINRLLVYKRVHDVLKIKTGVKEVNQSTSKSRYEKAWKILKGIACGDLDLTDASTSESAYLKTGCLEENTFSTLSDEVKAW